MGPEIPFLPTSLSIFTNLEVINIHMVFKAMKSNEVTMEGSAGKDENSETVVVQHERREDENKPTKETEKELLVCWRKKQKKKKV